MLHIKTELKSWFEDSVKFDTVPSKPSGRNYFTFAFSYFYKIFFILSVEYYMSIKGDQIGIMVGIFPPLRPL